MKTATIVKLGLTDPRRLFVIDGIGALVSVVMLGVVLVRYQHLVGIPTTTLYVLAALPILFALYDVYSYRSSERAGHHLQTIATINILYCCLSVGLAWWHYDTVTSWGWAYIIVEVLVVLALAVQERRVGRSLQGVA